MQPGWTEKGEDAGHMHYKKGMTQDKGLVWISEGDLMQETKQNVF